MLPPTKAFLVTLLYNATVPFAKGFDSLIWIQANAGRESIKGEKGVLGIWQVLYLLSKASHFISWPSENKTSLRNLV
jgi:hypothetical protein